MHPFKQILPYSPHHSSLLPLSIFQDYRPIDVDSVCCWTKTIIIVQFAVMVTVLKIAFYQRCIIVSVERDYIASSKLLRRLPTSSLTSADVLRPPSVHERGCLAPFVQSFVVDHCRRVRPRQLIETNSAQCSGSRANNFPSSIVWRVVEIS